MAKRSHHFWTTAEVDFLKENFEHLTCQEIADKLGCTVNGVKRKRYDLKIVKSKEALKKIYSRPNAGHFKQGGLPGNTLQDHAITVRKDNRGYQYQWIRISLAKWEMLHRYNWVQAGREIPEGSVVTFKDGNTMNASIENLELIHRRVSLMQNRKPVLLEKASNRRMIIASRLLEKQNRKNELLELRQATKALQQEKIKVAKLPKVQTPKASKVKAVALPVFKKVSTAPAVKKTPVKQFVSKRIDYSDKVLVRVDNKTCIYIGRDQDRELAIQLYKNNYHTKSI